MNRCPSRKYTEQNLQQQCLLESHKEKTTFNQVLRDLHPDKNLGCREQATQKFQFCNLVRERAANDIIKKNIDNVREIFSIIEDTVSCVPDNTPVDPTRCRARKEDGKRGACIFRQCTHKVVDTQENLCRQHVDKASFGHFVPVYKPFLREIQNGILETEIDDVNRQIHRTPVHGIWKMHYLNYLHELQNMKNVIEMAFVAIEKTINFMRDPARTKLLIEYKDNVQKLKKRIKELLKNLKECREQNRALKRKVKSHQENVIAKIQKLKQKIKDLKEGKRNDEDEEEEENEVEEIREFIDEELASSEDEGSEEEQGGSDYDSESSSEDESDENNKIIQDQEELITELESVIFKMKAQNLKLKASRTKLANLILTNNGNQETTEVLPISSFNVSTKAKDKSSQE